MITWKLWTGVPTVALWEAASLILNIEPTSLKPIRDAWMAGPGRGPFFEERSFPSRTKRDDFDRALSFAERAANVAGPIHLRSGLAIGMNKRKAQVSLPEVVEFFVGVEWPDIPLPLQALVDTGASVAPAEGEGKATTETPAARALIQNEAVPRFTAQERAVLDYLTSCEVNPRALPDRAAGRPGIKAEARRALQGTRLFVGETIFDKAWERLRAAGEIQDRNS